MALRQVDGYSSATSPFILQSAVFVSQGDDPQTEPISRLFSTGLRIEHALSAYPAFMVFWTFRFGALKAHLQALGVSGGRHCALIDSTPLSFNGVDSFFGAMRSFTANANLGQNLFPFASFRFAGLMHA
jgi:hypothetical protein